MGIVPRLQESYLVRPDIQHSISFRKGVIVDTEIGNWLFNQFAEHVKATSGKSLVMSVLPGHTESERRKAERAFSKDLELAKVFRSPHKEKELRGMLYSGARKLVQSEGLM
jgi:hypothetical protein